jgi:large subunit ribosomal protein L24
MNSKVKINKGDIVEVISGNDKGHRGEVQRVIRKKHKDGTYDADRVYVMVTGANLVIKHQRSTGRVGTQTGRIEKEAPIHISNVMLIGSEGKPTRVSYEVANDGSRERVDRKTGGAIPAPKK